MAGIFAAVPYCVDLIGGPYIETDPAVCKAFRPKSAQRAPPAPPDTLPIARTSASVAHLLTNPASTPRPTLLDARARRCPAALAARGARLPAAAPAAPDDTLSPTP